MIVGCGWWMAAAGKTVDCLYDRPVTSLAVLKPPFELAASFQLSASNIGGDAVIKSTTSAAARSKAAIQISGIGGS